MVGWKVAQMGMLKADHWVVRRAGRSAASKADSMEMTSAVQWVGCWAVQNVGCWAVQWGDPTAVQWVLTKVVAKAVHWVDQKVVQTVSGMAAR